MDEVRNVNFKGTQLIKVKMWYKQSVGNSRGN